MQVKSSEFLCSVKPLLKTLIADLLKKYEYASVLAVDSKSKRYGISNSGVTAGVDGSLSTRGFVVRVYDSGCYCEYSFNHITESELPDIIDTIDNKLTKMKANGELSSYPVPSDEPITLSKSTSYEIDPDEMGDEEILKRLTAMREKGLKVDSRLIDYNAIASYRKYSKLFISRNRDMEQNCMWANCVNLAIASENGVMRNSLKSHSGLCGFELLDEMEANLDKSAKEAVELLSAEPLTPGEYDCICTPEVTGMIVHEAFGHGVEMDMFVKDRALAKQFIGEYVASPLVTMHDSAASCNEVATYFFDDEGTLSHDTIIIDKGILKAGISDLQSALALGTEPTGNGRRESYSRKAYTRMTNTYFEGGKDTLEDMMASIKYGLMLEVPTSGMEDPKNWGIQCMVSFAREIKDGKFTGKLFAPVVLTGYVPDLLKSISMVSPKVELGGAGMCGKGYKEWVKVSDGGSYIKAKINLG